MTLAVSGGTVTFKYAGGARFETVLKFRVAHLSRRVTGGAFDLDSRVAQPLRRF